MPDTLWLAWADELAKLAAPRHIKILRALAKAGKFDEAEKLTKVLHDRGVLKTTARGTNIRHLGGGMEALTDLTVGAASHPSGLTARKLFDPKSPFFSKNILGNKFNIMRRLKGDPNFAKVLSKKVGRTPKGGRYLHTEYVEPSYDSPNLHAANSALERIRSNRGVTSSRRTPAIMDLHPGNTIGSKVVDFLATAPGRSLQARSAFDLPHSRLMPKLQHIDNTVGPDRIGRVVDDIMARRQAKGLSWSMDAPASPSSFGRRRRTVPQSARAHLG